jgi:hypothetical protein
MTPGQLNKYHKMKTETHTNCLAVPVKSWPVSHISGTVSVSIVTLSSVSASCTGVGKHNHLITYSDQTNLSGKLTI